MATIYPETFDGQRNISRGNENIVRPGEAHLAEILRESAGDFSTVLTALQALADKLDADAGVSDTDYRATLDGIVTAFSTVAG